MVTLKLKLLKLFNWGKGGSSCISVFFSVLAFSTSSTREPVHRLVYISLAVLSSVLMIRPRLGNLDSGIWNPWNFACGIQNPGLWNLEYSSRDLESHQRLESRIQVPLTKNLESSTWNLESGIRNLSWHGILNLRLNWIPLHEDTQPCSL